MYASLLQKIPLAIVGIFFLAAVCILYKRSKNVTRSEFWETFLAFLWKILYDADKQFVSDKSLVAV